MTTGSYQLTNGQYKDDNLEIIILTTANRDQYLPTKTVVTSKSDNLYVVSNGTTIAIPNNTTYTYKSGDMFYTGSVTVSDEALNNATYFGEDGEGANLIGTLTLDFLDALNTYLAQKPGIVVIKTDDGEESPAQINNEIMWALLGCSAITNLNLEGTYIESVDTYYPNASSNNDWQTVNADATLLPGHSTTKNTTLVTFVMPQTKKGSSFGANMFQFLEGLKNVAISEGVETLDVSSVDHNGQKYMLETITFPNTLKTIKKWALRDQTGILTFTFPKSLELIETAAFSGSTPRDVYFLGTVAPQVQINAWGDDAYIAEHSLATEVEDGETGQSVTVKMAQGVACRYNYHNSNGWECMLHYPAVLLETEAGKAQAARYTDLTREYKKIVYADFPKKKNDQNQDIAYYTAGYETEGIQGTTAATSSTTALKDFENMYAITVDPPYGGNYTGGYDDAYVGSQYTWPSMSMCDRATIVAQHHLLWNGTSTIGDGIRKYDSTYTGDGDEYRGMHQFVFAQADVIAEDTKEWDLSKYADGLWHTICLPFDMTKKNMEDVFGKNKDGNYSHIRLCKFNKVERTEGENAHIKLCFNDEQFHAATNDDDVVLHAHTSYMIHAAKEKAVEGEETTAIMTGYTMVSGNPQPTNVKAVSGETETDNEYRFIGNYLTDIKMPQYSYFFTKAQVFKFQTGTTGKWTAYTSVIEAPKGTEDNTLYFQGGSQAKLATLLDFAEGEDETTGIDKVTIEADGEIIYTTDNVYNLNGQLVSTNGLSGLAKGIYVVGGKKIAVK